jgi:hypothetical protein
MRWRAASIGICGMLALVTVPATMATAEAPPEDCGTVVGPRWTAPGNRSGRLWHVTESGTFCGIARLDVKRLLGERVDRHGRLRPPGLGFSSCSVDVRHRDIHPYAAGACVGDRFGVSWGIYPV